MEDVQPLGASSELMLPIQQQVVVGKTDTKPGVASVERKTLRKNINKLFL